MKRTNVIVDEELLERARRAGGEKTYSATINKALEEYVRKREFWVAYEEWAEETRKGGTFWPGYLEELRPPSRAVLTKPKARMSAHEQRAPRKKSTSRGSR
jgi:post-segregation antitoxin (ccd killing protein)